MEARHKVMEADRDKRRRRSGESISHNINSRDVNHKAGELSQVGKVELLSGGPGQRNPEQGKC